MIKFVVVVFVIVCLTIDVFPHYLWIETDNIGIKGVSHKAKLYYGEYSYDYIEETSAGFKDVNKFDLWLISPDNNKTLLSCTAADDHYYTEFIPESDGVYHLVMVNEDIDVVDWREWDLGVLKLGFYASASVTVGNNNSGQPLSSILPSAAKFLVTNSFEKTSSGNPATLKIYHNNELLKNYELTAGFIEGWTKKMSTDSTGIAEFSAPWNGLYIIEAVYTDKTAGSFNGKEYEAVRNVATYSLRLKK